MNRSAIIAEIIKIARLDSPIAEDEFTVAQFMEESGQGQHKSVAAKLNKLVKDGVLEKRQAVVDGHVCNVYRKVSHT